MNNVVLIGRLTKDLEVKYTSGSNPTAVARFNLAIDRPVKPGAEKQADFPSIVVFGKTAENCERFLKKGKMVAVQGRIQTGSYKNKDGATVYTTDVVADRVEFLDPKEKPEGSDEASKAAPKEPTPAPAGFEALDEEVPF